MLLCYSCPKTVCSNKKKMLWERTNLSRRRLLTEQIVAVVVLGCGTKVDAMWHVPQELAIYTEQY